MLYTGHFIMYSSVKIWLVAHSYNTVQVLYRSWRPMSSTNCPSLCTFCLLYPSFQFYTSLWTHAHRVKGLRERLCTFEMWYCRKILTIAWGKKAAKNVPELVKNETKWREKKKYRGHLMNLKLPQFLLEGKTVPDFMLLFFDLILYMSQISLKIYT